MDALEDKSTTTALAETKSTGIHYAVFLVFAEFLGYDSPIVDWAEHYCKTGELPEYQKKAIKINAFNVFKKMQEEYTIEEIRSWWDSYYDAILKGFDTKIQEIENMPF